MDRVERAIVEAIDLIQRWEGLWGPFERDRSLEVPDHLLHEILHAYADRLTDNYPYFHPRYAGQMLKPPHALAAAAYTGAMLVNPNNHALDGGPATAAMEKEAVAELIAMIGFPAQSLGHLTSSGTIANLEALWVARELTPTGRLVASELAHYTHERMAGLLRIEIETLPCDRIGRLDLDAFEASLRRGGVGTAIVTAGTPGFGAVDPIAEVVSLARQHGIRVHVDAAYGGFYRILATDREVPLDDRVAEDLVAISQADSVVIDPHKHGLQPYGCGCVLFRDSSVGSIYRHDSPYTYFTSDDLHLGEISLECSRAGAAAGALWATLRAFPLTPEGLGSVLAGCRRAALKWHELLSESDVLEPLHAPQLDIVTFRPRSLRKALDVDAASQRLFERAMKDPLDPVFLSVLRVEPRLLGLSGDDQSPRGGVRVLRSVLMKPEHQDWVPRLHARLEALARMHVE